MTKLRHRQHAWWPTAGSQKPDTIFKLCLPMTTGNSCQSMRLIQTFRTPNKQFRPKIKYCLPELFPNLSIDHLQLQHVRRVIFLANPRTFWHPYDGPTRFLPVRTDRGRPNNPTALCYVRCGDHLPPCYYGTSSAAVPNAQPPHHRSSIPNAHLQLSSPLITINHVRPPKRTLMTISVCWGRPSPRKRTRTTTLPTNHPLINSHKFPSFAATVTITPSSALVLQSGSLSFAAFPFIASMTGAFVLVVFNASSLSHTRHCPFR